MSTRADLYVALAAMIIFCCCILQTQSIMWFDPKIDAQTTQATVIVRYCHQGVGYCDTNWYL